MATYRCHYCLLISFSSYLVYSSWTTWNQWGKCFGTCSNGAQTRRRHCMQGTVLIPTYLASSTCPGPGAERKFCRRNQCKSKTCTVCKCVNKCWTLLIYDFTLVGDLFKLVMRRYQSNTLYLVIRTLSVVGRCLCVRYVNYRKCCFFVHKKHCSTYKQDVWMKL